MATLSVEVRLACRLYKKFVPTVGGGDGDDAGLSATGESQRRNPLYARGAWHPLRITDPFRKLIFPMEAVMLHLTTPTSRTDEEYLCHACAAYSSTTR